METNADRGLNGASTLFCGVWLLAFMGAIFLVAVVPENAWAWGAGIHVSQGSFVLENLNLIKPHIAAILATNPMDYIYGCVSADIFIGKGYRRRDDHCHNWSVGMKTLNNASDDSTKAYAYGYLTHLAADVIAHNYFIPKLLCTTPAPNGLGHVYWEFRADRFVKKKYWALASKVVSMHNHDNDTLIKKVMNRSKLRFGAKKMVFKRAIRINDLLMVRRRVETAPAPPKKITRKQIITLNNYALNLILDFLRNGEKSLALEYDPVGTDNMIKARQIRKSGKRNVASMDIEKLFETPDCIVNNKIVGNEAMRI